MSDGVNYSGLAGSLAAHPYADNLTYRNKPLGI